MKPVNSKSLFAFICTQMEKLDNKEIDVQTANSQAGLVKQANNVLNYELKRAETQIKLSSHNKEYSENIQIREIESKGFDDTTHIKDPLMNNPLEKKLDDIFSEYTRIRDADYNGYIRCYCCGYPVHWKLAQNGHFMNRRHQGTRFNEQNCHSCCTVCNMSLNGNLEAYEAHLRREYGENIIDKLTMLKNTVTKFADFELKEKIEYYQNEVKKLRKEKGL